MRNTKDYNKIPKEPYRSKTIDHKIFIYTVITIIAILGALVPFASQFILPFFYPCYKITGAEVWNQYVSIILGVVATLMSIISLKLSFDNVDQSHITELRNIEILHQIESKLSDIKHGQEDYLTKTDIMGLLRNGYKLELDASINNQWTKQQDSKTKESKDI